MPQKFFKHTLTVTVLSTDKDPNKTFGDTDWTLEDVHRAIDSGDAIGDFEVMKTEEIPPTKLADELEAVGGDDNFFDSCDEDLWKYRLHSGDEVTIGIGDDQKQVVIQTVEYHENDVVVIVDKEGLRHECRVSEIS